MACRWTKSSVNRWKGREKFQQINVTKLFSVNCSNCDRYRWPLHCGKYWLTQNRSVILSPNWLNVIVTTLGKICHKLVPGGMIMIAIVIPKRTGLKIDFCCVAGFSRALVWHKPCPVPSRNGCLMLFFCLSLVLILQNCSAPYAWLLSCISLYFHCC